MATRIVNGQAVPLTAAEVAEQNMENAAWEAAASARAALARISEIDARLAQIDLESIRPARAVNVGTAGTFDRDKLAALENEAGALRVERAGLSGAVP